jgi:hypothetical protein
MRHDPSLPSEGLAAPLTPSVRGSREARTDEEALDPGYVDVLLTSTRKSMDVQVSWGFVAHAVGAPWPCIRLCTRCAS